MSKKRDLPYYKNGVYIKQPYETRKAGSTEKDSGDWNKDIRYEPQVTLYYSMLVSDAWYNLTGNAAKLYHYMKMQAYSNNKNKNTKPDDLDYCRGTEFCFNKALIQKAYADLYPSMTQYYRDLRCLIENGFIKVIHGGAFTTRAVYDLSDEWQSVKRKKKDMTKTNTARKKKQKSDTQNDTTKI